MVIPHGQSWGLYTPAGYTLDKSLEHSKKFPKMFELLETYSSMVTLKNIALGVALMLSEMANRVKAFYFYDG